MKFVRTMIAAAMLACLYAPAGAAEAAATPQSANEEIHVILYRKGPAWVEGKPMSEQGLRPHGLYIKALLEDGKLMAAGPLTESDGGLVLTRFTSREEALKAVEADPAVKGGIFTAEVQTWVVRFSDGTVEAKDR